MTYKESISALKAELKTMGQAGPEALSGFRALSKAVTQTPVLDAKQQELIALGMAVVQRCEPCIMLHTEALQRSGATREELVAMLGLAIQMSGGPGLMYAAHTLKCWDDLAA